MDSFMYLCMHELVQAPPARGPLQLADRTCDPATLCAPRQGWIRDRQCSCRRLQEEEKEGRRHHRQKQEEQQQKRNAQSQAEQLEGEKHKKEEEHVTAHVTLLQGVGETFEQMHQQNQLSLGECCRVQENTLSWPLHRQHELSIVQLMGRCLFQEVAAHGQERSANDVQGSRFRRRHNETSLQTALHSLPSLERANNGLPMADEGGVAATGAKEGGGGRALDEDEAQEEKPPGSSSVVLQPKLLASWRSGRDRSTEEAGSLLVRSLTSVDSAECGFDTVAQRDRSTKGMRHAADDTAVAVFNDVESALGENAACAAVAGDSDRLFPAVDANAGSPYKKSFASICCLWSKKIFCSRTRWHYLIFLCIYAYLIGPVYLNWAPLRELLFRSGAYAWECDPAEQNPKSLRYISPDVTGSGGRGRGGRGPSACTLQRLRVGNLYTVCAAADFGFSFFGGLVVDWLGPKTGSLLGSSSMLAGWLLLALSCESAPLYLPGVALFGIGIDMAFYGTMSVARLFPGHANTVLAAVVGMRGLGLMSPLILNALPLSFTVVMLGYALLGLLPAVLIASVYAPWKPFQSGDLEEKKRTQQRAEALWATSGGSSNDVPLDAKTRVSHRNPPGSLRAALQDTATDPSRAIEVMEQQPYSETQQLLLGIETEEEQSNHRRRQQRRQEGRQLESVRREQEEGDRQASVSVPAGSEKTQAEERHGRSKEPVAAEEKQRLLQLGVAEAGEKHESNPNTIYGNDVEEGWLSDTGVSEERRRRLLSLRPQLLQDGRQVGLTAERESQADAQQLCGRGREEIGRQIVHGGTHDALRKENRRQDPGGSNTTVHTGSKGDTSLPPLSVTSVRHPGEFFLAASSSSSPSAQITGGAPSVKAKPAIYGAAATPPLGVASDTADNLENDFYIPTGAETGAVVGVRQATGPLAMLQQQQQHGKELRSAPTQPNAQQSQPAGSTSVGARDSKRDEAQQKQPAAFRGGSGGKSKDKVCTQFVGAGRRTLSTAADEESTEMYGTGSVKVLAERTSAEERGGDWKQSVSGGGGSGAVVSEQFLACGEGPAAATSPAATSASGRRGTSTTEGGWNLELGAVLSPTNESTTRAPAEGETHGQPNEAHAAALFEGRQKSLRRPLRSSQFPRTCAGRMRYLVAYIRQHPWTVDSVVFLRDYLFTLLYLPVVPYFTLSLMRSVYFSDASEDLVPSALSTLHVLLACVCIVPPVMGLLADTWSIMPCLVLVNTTGTLVILGSLLANLTHIVAFEYVAVISYMPFAAVLTNQVYFYVADTFPQRHLGKLCGFACSIGGVTSLSVTPMFEFSVKTHGGFTVMLCIMSAISGICYGLIAVLYVAQKRAKTRQAEAAAAAAGGTEAADTPPKPATAGNLAFSGATAAPPPQEKPPLAAVLRQGKKVLTPASATPSVCRTASIRKTDADRVRAAVHESATA